MLSARDLYASYGAAEVLRGVTLEVRRGEAVALLGPNGAGKTTTLRCLTGALRPRKGEIMFDGAPLRARTIAELARAGVGYVPEGRGIARSLTVGENLRLGGYRFRRDRAAFRREHDRVLETFPALQEALDRRAGTLSGGQQQMLAIGRALMAAPSIMLIDEASLGLAPIIVTRLYDVLRALKAGGMTFLIVEQTPAKVLAIADRAYVLQKGEVVLEGSAESMRHSDLLSAYLGEAPEAISPVARARAKAPAARRKAPAKPTVRRKVAPRATKTMKRGKISTKPRVTVKQPVKRSVKGRSNGSGARRKVTRSSR